MHLGSSLAILSMFLKFRINPTPLTFHLCYHCKGSPYHVGCMEPPVNSPPSLPKPPGSIHPTKHTARSPTVRV